MVYCPCFVFLGDPAITMTQLTQIVTAAALLMHSMLGCCTHEAHGASGGCCGATHSNISSENSENDSVAKHSDCPFCKSPNMAADGKTSNDESSSPVECRSSSDSHEPSTPHECRHSSCKSIAPRGEDHADYLTLHFIDALTFSSEVPFASLQEERGGLSRLTPFASPHTLPVRRHLAKLVFLI